MKKTSTIFLQTVIVILGVAVLALMLWEPHVEGRNVHSTTFEIYFHDPFLAYAYTGSIAFFTALFQGFRLLGFVRRGEVFSLESVKALRIIKICAIVIVAFLLGAELFFGIVQRGKEDIAGAVMLGLILIFISAVVGTAAAVFERTLQSAVELKRENDLTV